MKNNRIIEGDINWEFDKYGRPWHYFTGSFREISEDWYHQGFRNPKTGITTDYLQVFENKGERFEGIRFYKTLIGTFNYEQKKKYLEWDENLYVCKLIRSNRKVTYMIQYRVWEQSKSYYKEISEKYFSSLMGEVIDCSEKEDVLQIGKDLVKEICMDENEVNDLNAGDSDDETEQVMMM